MQASLHGPTGLLPGAAKGSLASCCKLKAISAKDLAKAWVEPILVLVDLLVLDVNATVDGLSGGDQLAGLPRKS